MRIAVVNSTRRRVGGVESYLEQLLPALAERGHETAFLFESDLAAGAAIQLQGDAPQWLLDADEAPRTLRRLKDWRPDRVFLHSVVGADMKAELLDIAPAIFFAHNYHGTCISGLKRHAFPGARVCEKTFSPACLAHYFPRRCGGWSPATMWRRYQSEKAWLAGLKDFAAIVVASNHMAAEYRRHGFADRVSTVGLPIRDDAPARAREFPAASAPVRLLFTGRMEPYKGGAMLLDALPLVREGLRREVHLVFLGDGREREAWETRANSIVRANPGIGAEFPGWLPRSAMARVIKAADLLVLPSLWPEPFGLVGLEAGAYGLPTAAFRVGGIPDWLEEGNNGHLADGDPPTADGLAEAIMRCLAGADHYEELCVRAKAMLQRFTMDVHLQRLERVMTAVAPSGSL